MANTADIERIKEQESSLVFDRFDENVAYEIGAALRANGLADGLPIVIDIQSFDRPLFYAALPGSDVSNRDWARRKINVVKRYLRSSYSLMLERAADDRLFKPSDGLDVADYVLAGGGFPVRVEKAGVVGVVAISGLPDREDHNVIVAALCSYLGRAPASLSLREQA
jgi:uncharacterized protein (UPF0303 family)